MGFGADTYGDHKNKDDQRPEHGMKFTISPSTQYSPKFSQLHHEIIHLAPKRKTVAKKTIPEGVPAHKTKGSSASSEKIM